MLFCIYLYQTQTFELTHVDQFLIVNLTSFFPIKVIVWVWRFLKTLEIELSYDPAILLLGIHTEETRIERDTCTPMFITALFIIARTRKQPRCSSANEWIRKLWYIYTMEYYSAIEKNTFESVLNEVDETGAYYTEWSKPERKTPIQYTNTYIWNLERW